MYRDIIHITRASGPVITILVYKDAFHIVGLSRSYINVNEVVDGTVATSLTLLYPPARTGSYSSLKEFSKARDDV